MAPLQPVESAGNVAPPSPLLFTPLTLGSLELKNRIVISPMCQYSSVDGFANDWHLVHLGSRAIGGAGVVMMEATAVQERGRISAGCPGIWKDEHIPALKRITDFIKEQNSVPAIQLAHSGRRQATVPPWIAFNKPLTAEEGWWQGIGPSAFPYGGGNEEIPLEATQEDIEGFISSFTSAARRCLEAGFQLIEFHFAHGYLVQSFMSPLANKRTDDYGGSFENRIRLALEIVQSVKAVLPEGFPLLVRISSSDNYPEGWTVEESIEFARRIHAVGVHLIDCSSGEAAHYAKSWAATNRIDQIAMAETIQRKSGVPTGAVGAIVNPKWAETILQQKKATLIFIGRASLNDSSWPHHAAAQLGAVNHQIPNQYKWAIGKETPNAWRQTILAKNNADKLNATE